MDTINKNNTVLDNTDDERSPSSVIDQAYFSMIDWETKKALSSANVTEMRRYVEKLKKNLTISTYTEINKRVENMIERQCNDIINTAVNIIKRSNIPVPDSVMSDKVLERQEASIKYYMKYVPHDLFLRWDYLRLSKCCKDSNFFDVSNIMTSIASELNTKEYYAYGDCN